MSIAGCEHHMGMYLLSRVVVALGAPAGGTVQDSAITFVVLINDATRTIADMKI